MTTEVRDPWYRDGLRFRCTGCGGCCRGAGNVWVGEAEIDALAVRLGSSREEFCARYTRRPERRGVSLRQKRNQDCVFWDAEQGCTVYEDRPRQCQSYPFWSANVRSQESWALEAVACPGIGAGDLHDAEAIARTAADDGIPPHRTRLRNKPLLPEHEETLP
jgi:Fe-S-cluster containining protein